VRPHLVLASTSRVEDGAYQAMADIAGAAASTGSEYRVIGGHMVTVHVARSGADLPARATRDADVGLEAQVLASTGLVEALLGMGYEMEGGNRLVRAAAGSGCAIDVLVPTDTSRVRHNRPVGDLFVDEAPGLRYALARPAMTVDLEVRLTTAVTARLQPAVPDLTAAICLKVLAYHSRAEPRDAFDVWRLLEVARADGLAAPDWPTTPTPQQVAELLRSDFVPANGRGVLDASASVTRQARLRLLATALAGRGPA
jgi:hypothetical protein